MIVTSIECDKCKKVGTSSAILTEDAVRDESVRDGWIYVREEGIDLCPKCAKIHSKGKRKNVR